MSALFSIKETQYRKLIKILGIKISIKNEKLKIFANKDWYMKHWSDFPTEIAGQYKKLMQGLDNESMKIVNTIIKRIQMLKRHKFNCSFNAYSYEAKIIKEIDENLRKQITDCGSGICAYRDYLMYEGMFEPGIFYYNCYTDYLKDLKKIRNSNIIDVGAYVGDSSIVLSKLTDKNVYAFEPVKANFDFIDKVAKLNGISNIIPVNKGLGAENEKLPIYSKKSMGASFCDSTNCDIPVEVVTLDDFVKENNIKVGLIKVDIEGFEQSFLKGATETIKSQKPALLISIYHNSNDFFYIKPLIESWNLGYEFKIRKAFDDDVVRDTMLICEG